MRRPDLEQCFGCALPCQAALQTLFEHLDKGVLRGHVVLPGEVEIRLNVAQIERALVNLVEVAQPAHAFADLLKRNALGQVEAERRAGRVQRLDFGERVLDLRSLEQLVGLLNKGERLSEDVLELDLRRPTTRTFS